MNYEQYFNENVNMDIMAFKDTKFMQPIFFAYVAIGPKYINYLIENFKTFPDDIEVLVMTNTPEAFKNVFTNFKLHIADIEAYRSDKNREQEPLVRVLDDEELYKQNIKKLFSAGTPFSIATQRHILTWMIDHNISKFFICDVGARPYKFRSSIVKLENLSHNQNIMVIRPQGGIVWETPHALRYMKELDCLDIFNKNGIDLNYLDKKFLWKLLHSESSTIEEMDGWFKTESVLLGFWFNDISYVQKYYDIWNSMVERAFELPRNQVVDALRVSVEGHLIGTEGIIDPLNAIFCRQFNILLVSPAEIILHIYTGNPWFTTWQDW